MWAIRRASVQLRNRGLISGNARVFCGRPEIARCLEKYNAGFDEPQEKLFDGLLSSLRFYNTSSSSSRSYREVRTFSSQADATSSGEKDDDLEDGFSELETPLNAAQENSSGEENDDELTSGSELSEEESVADDSEIELAALDTETDVEMKKSRGTRGLSAMTKVILAARAQPVSTVLDKWVEEGNEATQTVLTVTMIELRRRRMYPKALQLSEWMENHVEFVERNYASRVDLIAKVRGIFKAEEYLKQIPNSFRSELVYRSLLANCVSANNVKKSEDLFNKMKALGLPLTSFSCNQLLLLYKRTDKKKIADVLLLMEKENIKPTLFTYQILIDVKGQTNDIAGMEQLIETMKDQGLEPNIQIQASLARYYASSGVKEKAEAILKEMEGDDLTKKRWVCRLLLPIYASLGREDEVQRIWEVCQQDTGVKEFMAAIEAWGQLKKIKNAEAAFDKMMSKIKKPNAGNFTVLLNVYANNKMLEKGKDLVRRMAESGCNVGPLTWDAIVKLYVTAGEVEKADSVLEKATKQKRGRPLFTSFLALLDQYANRGDIHNAEKIFLKMRQAGYTARVRQYQSLLKAYIVGKAPAYGFSERLKADNIFPNKALAGQLAQVDAFRKTAVSELLE